MGLIKNQSASDTDFSVNIETYSTNLYPYSVVHNHTYIANAYLPKKRIEEDRTFKLKSIWLKKTSYSFKAVFQTKIIIFKWKPG